MNEDKQYCEECDEEFTGYVYEGGRCQECYVILYPNLMTDYERYKKSRIWNHPNLKKNYCEECDEEFTGYVYEGGRCEDCYVLLYPNLITE